MYLILRWLKYCTCNPNHTNITFKHLSIFSTIKCHILFHAQQNQCKQSLSSITIHTRAYRNHSPNQVPKKNQNGQKQYNCVRAAWRFIAATQKLGLVLVSPGSHVRPARQFLEKFQKPDFIYDFHVSCHPNPVCFMIESKINHNNIKHTIGNPLTWIFLSFALNLASFPLTTNVFLLLSLETTLKLHSKLTQNPPIRALYCTHTDNLTKPFLLFLISFLLSP